MDAILQLLGFHDLREFLTLIFASGVPLAIIVAALRHYHRLRSKLAEAMHNENRVKLDENHSKISDVATDVGEIKAANLHIHECLEDLKGRVAANNSHEARISRLEDERMVPRRLVVNKRAAGKKR